MKLLYKVLLQEGLGAKEAENPQFLKKYHEAYSSDKETETWSMF